jgi:hypothetical protein
MWWIHGGWGDLNLEQAYHGLLFFWALVSLLIGMAALVARSDSVSGRTIAGFSVAAFWFSWPLLYHQFGSQSVTDFVPIHRLSRHLVVYAPGAIFGTVAGIAVLGEVAAKWRRLSGRRALTAVAAAILLTHLSFNWQGEQLAYNAYHRIKGTYARIRERLPTDVKTIIADPGDLCFFDFWLNPLGVERVRMVAFANYSGCHEIEPGLLLTHSNPGWEGAGAPVIQETVRRLPCLLAPPANWRLLYDGHPERVYAIDTGRDAGS